MKKLFYLLAGLAVLTIATGCNGRLDDEDYYVENPNWYVEYDGRTVYPDTAMSIMWGSPSLPGMKAILSAG